jgi:fatty-acid desaturase
VRRASDAVHVIGILARQAATFLVVVVVKFQDGSLADTEVFSVLVAVGKTSLSVAILPRVGTVAILVKEFHQVRVVWFAETMSVTVHRIIAHDAFYANAFAWRAVRPKEAICTPVTIWEVDAVMQAFGAFGIRVHS